MLHGTAIAAIAAGKTRGVAPAADLFLVKVTHSYIDTQAKEVGIARLDPVAVANAFRKIVRVIHDRKLQGRAVFVTACGK